MKQSKYKFADGIFFRVSSLVLCFAILCISYASMALANQVNVFSVKTQRNIRIVFNGSNNQFTYNYNQGVIAIKFQPDDNINNYKDLELYGDVIESVAIDKDTLIIALFDKNTEIARYVDGSQYGIEIRSKSAFLALDKFREQSLANQAKAGEIKISDGTNGTIVSLGFNAPVKSAGFQRANRYLVIFNSYVPFNQIDFKNQFIQKIQTHDITNKYTLLEITIDPQQIKNKHAVFYQTNNNWNLEFTDSLIKPKDMRVISRPQAAPLPLVDIEFEEKPEEIISFRDPLINDTITVIPVSESSVGVTATKTFVDFIIHQSFQGLVIEKLSDFIDIKIKNNIATVQGSISLNISPKVYAKRAQNYSEDTDDMKADYFAIDMKTILNLKNYSTDNEHFLEKENYFKYAIRITKAPERRARVYANWAFFYLANRMYSEANTVLKLLKHEDSSFANTYNVKLIETAIQFMQNDFITAQKTVQNINMSDTPIGLRKEIRFWQTITSYMVNSEDAYFSKADPISTFVNDKSNFLEQYTQEFMVQIGIAIASFKIKDKQHSDVLVILNKISDYSDVPFGLKNKIFSLYAAFYSSQEKVQEATEYWDKCIGDVQDLLNRTLCRFEKLKYFNYMQQITIDEYIAELEKLTAVWRGDDLEIEMLKMLGDAYMQSRDYAAALRSWDKIVRYYPHNPVSLTLSKKTADVFINFFLHDDNTTISHFKALSLFYEFQRLIPFGALGDEVVLKFTDHLIALDLLDRAAAILSHQIAHRLHGYRKEEIINKLAKIHLLNHAPQYAIDAIRYGDKIILLPDYIGKERKYLLATAYFQNHDDAEALALIKDDLSQQADDIKADIFWRKKLWREFNKFAEPRIYMIRSNTDVINNEDASKVLKLTISYLILDERLLLKNLYKDFAHRMPAGINAEIMSTIVNSWKAPVLNLNELDKAITEINEVIEKLSRAKKLEATK